MGILGVILGIVAVAIALFGTFMFGTTGMIVALVAAAAAIVLALLKRSKDTDPQEDMNPLSPQHSYKAFEELEPCKVV